MYKCILSSLSTLAHLILRITFDVGSNIIMILQKRKLSTTKKVNNVPMTVHVVDGGDWLPSVLLNSVLFFLLIYIIHPLTDFFTLINNTIIYLDS